jgi:hypothetical protein
MKHTQLLYLEPYNTYLDFLEECRNKKYAGELVVHKHHIIPRCFFKEDKILGQEYTQLISLSVQDHIQAHLLLAKCFDEESYEQVSNLRAAKLLSKNSIELREELLKIYQAQRGEGNSSKRPEVRKKLSESKKGRQNEKKAKSYEEIYGDRAEQEKQKRKKTTRSKQAYQQSAQKAKETAKKRGTVASGAKNGWAKQVVVDGVLYETVREACEKLNISRYKLQKLL